MCGGGGREGGTGMLLLVYQLYATILSAALATSEVGASKAEWTAFSSKSSHTH